MHQLAVFAKFWAPGAVKTRLGRTVGPVAAAELYRQMLRLLLDRCAQALQRGELALEELVLVAWPPEQVGEMARWAGPPWKAACQPDGTLGHRLAQWFDQAYCRGVQWPLVIGSDSPDLPGSILQQALHACSQVDVVLGPTEDGGYYLVGGRDVPPEMFVGIDWSTPQVYQQTLDRLDQLDRSVAILPTWYDVDQWEDLLRLQPALHSLAPHFPAAEVLRKHVERLIAMNGGNG